MALISLITIASSKRFELGTQAGELGVDIVDREGIHWGQPGAWEKWIGGGSGDGLSSLDEKDFERRFENSNAGFEIQAIPNEKVTGNIRGGDLLSSHGDLQLIESNDDGSEIPNERFFGDTHGHDLVVPGAIQIMKPSDPGFNIEGCTFIEAAIGMGTNFGKKAKCECKGDFATCLDVSCSFDECAPGSKVCGTVNLDFNFGEPDGIINTTACTSFKDDKFKETCISHRMDVKGDSRITWINVESDYSGSKDICEATYGGQQCECNIEDNVCLSVDCSPLLSGGKTNTCQFLSMVDDYDTENWFPKFDVFQPSTTIHIDSAGCGMVGGGAALAAAMATTGFLVGQLW